MNTTTEDNQDVQFQLKYELCLTKGHCHQILEASKTEGALYLGDMNCAQDLVYFLDKNISVVLDVAGLKYEYPTDIVTNSKSIEAFDMDDFDLSSHFQECFDFIHENRTKGKNVFVHCMAGVSRSATVIIGYIMTIMEMDLEAAYKFVYEKRKCIYPNHGFLRQLRKLEKELKTKQEQAQNQQVSIEDPKNE